MYICTHVMNIDAAFFSISQSAEFCVDMFMHIDIPVHMHVYSIDVF